MLSLANFLKVFIMKYQEFIEIDPVLRWWKYIVTCTLALVYEMNQMIVINIDYAIYHNPFITGHMWSDVLFSIIDADVLVLMHQAISIHNTGSIVNAYCTTPGAYEARIILCVRQPTRYDIAM